MQPLCSPSYGFAKVRRLLWNMSEPLEEETTMTARFVPEDFNIPLGLECKHFRLEPLSVEHNERDHEAWTSSIAHIQNTPGFPIGKARWPFPMSLEKNLKDMKRHSEDFALRNGYTYSVLDGDDVIGCVYLYPTEDSAYDVDVKSWVTADRASLDRVLWKEVSVWLAKVWPFKRVQYAAR